MTAVLHPDDLLITPRLYERTPRPDDLNAELSAFRELSAVMTEDPQIAIQRFLDLAVELCPTAGSSGLSELTTDASGEPIFSWTAMSGAFAPYVGGTTPRHFSPCGLCLDQHHTILVDRPARLFTYFNDAEPEIVEGLVVPLYDTGKRPIGTLWVTSHEQGPGFDASDARVMEQLAIQLVLAIKIRGKSENLAQLQNRVRDRDIFVQEVRHRVKNMIQMTAGLLQLQERAVSSNEARSALREAQSRLLVLAGVYEGLLGADAGTAEIDIATLIKTLVNALQQGSSHGRRVTVRAECSKMLVKVASAVPIGLIVNEAVTNALKHGFNEDGRGEVTVRLQSDSGSCLLTISDDGAGFDGPVRQGSLGMRLMKNLARQLRATLAIDGSDGTTVKVEWTVPDGAAETSEAGAQPLVTA